MSRGTIDDFCTQVCRCVRFWPDHEAITAELTAHLEDHAAALEARGLSPEEAAAQAVTAMGEPEELGRQLDRAHPPLLCLSVAATNIILVFLLVVCILALALWSLDSAKTVLARRAAPEDTRAHYQERYEYPLAIDEWAEVDGLWLHFHTIGVMSSAGQPFAYEIYLTCDPADGWLPDNGSPRLEMHFVENVPGNVFYRFVADTGWECIPATSLHSGVNRWIILPQLPPEDAEHLWLEGNVFGHTFRVEIPLLKEGVQS